MASEVKKIYEFGRFRFDAARLRLEHAGEQIAVSPKSLETLKILLEEKGEIVRRETLLEKIWAESYVEDANLTVAVSTLRKTLSVYDDQPFIETIQRKGYRFVGDAEEKIEITEKPIVVERHAVEELTIEKIAPRLMKKKTRTAQLLFFALLGLIAVAGAFAFWRQSAANTFNLKAAAAEQAFLKGDQLMQKRLTVCDSISYFREAIAKDENHARAHANLAAALAMCADPDREAGALVARALELDPTMAEAHATDGFIKMFVDWDWDGAESSLRRAVALDPNSAKARHWLGVALSIRGNFLEARGEVARAIEIAPDSPLYRADLCQINYFENNLSRALTECRKAERLDPNFLFYGTISAGCLFAGGRRRKGLGIRSQTIIDFAISA